MITESIQYRIIEADGTEPVEQGLLSSFENLVDLHDAAKAFDLSSYVVMQVTRYDTLS